MKRADVTTTPECASRVDLPLPRSQLPGPASGAFLAWLSPVQLVVLPISVAEQQAAAQAMRRAVALGLRAELAGADQGSLGACIHANRHVPFQAVIGAREAADGLAAVRLRDGRRLDPAPVVEALSHIRGAVDPLGREKVGENA
jgi:threonyl-tRNA synthetase